MSRCSVKMTSFWCGDGLGFGTSRMPASLDTASASALAIAAGGENLAEQRSPVRATSCPRRCGGSCARGLPVSSESRFRCAVPRSIAPPLPGRGSVLPSLRPRVGSVFQIIDILLVEDRQCRGEIDSERSGRRAEGSQARAAGFPAVRGGGAVTDKSLLARTRGAAAGSSARIRPSLPACRFPALPRD